MDCWAGFKTENTQTNSLLHSLQVEMCEREREGERFEQSGLSDFHPDKNILPVSSSDPS